MVHTRHVCNKYRQKIVHLEDKNVQMQQLHLARKAEQERYEKLSKENGGKPLKSGSIDDQPKWRYKTIKTSEVIEGDGTD